MEDVEQQPPEPRKGISRHLTEEGALPICEQCNSGGLRGLVQISVDSDGSAGFRVSTVWVHKPFGEADCRACTSAMNAFGQFSRKPTVG